MNRREAIKTFAAILATPSVPVTPAVPLDTFGPVAAGWKRKIEHVKAVKFDGNICEVFVMVPKSHGRQMSPTVIFYRMNP